MFVAHLPAGYLVTRRIARRPPPRLLALGLVASVLPDLDLLRFYWVDGRRILHHAYWTHEPFWWALLAAGWFSVALVRGSRAWTRAGAVFFANVLGHLALDTVAGRIRWLAPFSDRSFALVTVPPGHAWWVSNFLLHWTFLLELAILAIAAWELRRARKAPPSAHVERTVRTSAESSYYS